MTISKPHWTTQPSAHPHTQNENQPNTTRQPLKNRNWTAARYPTRKPEPATNTPPMAAAPQAITPWRCQPHPPLTKWPKEGLTARKKIMTKLLTRLSPIPIPIPTENVRKPLATWRPQGGQEWNIRRKWVNDIYLYSFAHSFTKSSFTFLKWKKQAVILKDYLLLKNIFA